MSSPLEHSKGAQHMASAGELLDRAARRIDHARKFVAPADAISYRAVTQTRDGRRWRVTIEPIAAR